MNLPEKYQSFFFKSSMLVPEHVFHFQSETSFSRKTTSLASSVREKQRVWHGLLGPFNMMISVSFHQLFHPSIPQPISLVLLSRFPLHFQFSTQFPSLLDSRSLTSYLGFTNCITSHIQTDRQSLLPHGMEPKAALSFSFLSFGSLHDCIFFYHVDYC
jgi:hypothetical protein